MSSLTVGIAGITGRFGRMLALQLLQNRNISVRGYARNLGKAKASFSESDRLKLFNGEAFDDAAIKPFVAGCDVVVCTYQGAPDLMINGQKKLIDACEEAGVPRYVTSDWVLDYTKLQLGEFSLQDPKIHVKAYLETKQSVKGVHILNGGFMEVVLGPFFNIWDPRTKTLQYWGEGTEPWEVTSYDNATHFSAAVIADTSAVGVKKYLDERKNIFEIADAIEKVYGFKPQLRRLGSLDDLKARMHALQAGNPFNVFRYLSLFFMYYWINGETFVGPETDKEKYPQVKTVTWEDFLKTSYYLS